MRERVSGCASVSVECASVSVRERVFSRTPEEWEDSDPITGIGLGVMPVGPHTPRRSVLDHNPSSSATGATLHDVESAGGHSRGLADAGDNPTSALEVCGITILGRRPTPGGRRMPGLSGGRVDG